MTERDCYPAGAYSDPNAPYNEYTQPEREVPVKITCAYDFRYIKEDHAEMIRNREVYTPMQIMEEYLKLAQEKLEKLEAEEKANQKPELHYYQSDWRVRRQKFIIEDCKQWKEVEQEDKSIVVMEMETELVVDDYVYWEDHDEDGGCCGFDYSECNFREAMEEGGVYTPKEILKDFCELAKEKVESHSLPYREERKLWEMILDCTLWEDDDIDIECQA